MSICKTSFPLFNLSRKAGSPTGNNLITLFSERFIEKLYFFEIR